MPDPMSPDPEVDAVTNAIASLGSFDGRHAGPRFRADLIVTALHAAGYRVVAEGDYAEGVADGWAAAAKAVSDHEMHEDEMCGADCIVLGLVEFAAPTEEERQHE